jgi:hypothetical protein
MDRPDHRRSADIIDIVHAGYASMVPVGASRISDSRG